MRQLGILIAVVFIVVGCSSPEEKSSSSEQPVTITDNLRVSRSNSSRPGSASVEVVVWGEGDNEEEARERAFRNAIGHVVGIFMDAKTIVQNRQVIEDKALSVANGFVENFQIIETDNSRGAFRVKYRVFVRQAPLIGSLVTDTQDERTIGGDQLSSSARTQIARNREIVAALSSILSEHPKQSVAATMMDFGIGENVGTSDQIPVYVDVAFQWRPLWIRRFFQLLDAMHTEGGVPAFMILDKHHDVNNNPPRLWLGSGHEQPLLKQVRTFKTIPFESARPPALIRIPRAALESIWFGDDYLYIQFNFLKSGRNIFSKNVVCRDLYLGLARYYRHRAPSYLESLLSPNDDLFEVHNSTRLTVIRTPASRLQAG